MKKAVLALSILSFAGANVNAASLWASDSVSGPSRLFELNPVTGAVLSSIPGPGTFADALSFANDGNSIFVLDSSVDSRVYQIDLAGSVLNSFMVPLDAEGLTILADGTLWIGGGNSGVIANVNPLTGGIISQFAVNTQVYGMASDGSGTLYGLQIDGDIDTYTTAGAFLGTIDTSLSGTALGLAYAPDGFYIATTGSTIYKLDHAGNVLYNFSGPGGFTEGLDFPQGVQVAVPEAASSLTLLALGAAAIGAARRKR